MNCNDVAKQSPTGVRPIKQRGDVNGAPNCVTNAHSGPFAEGTNAMTAVMAKDDTVQGVDQTLSSLSDVARR
jgi:hypothetical protein